MMLNAPSFSCAGPMRTAAAPHAIAFDTSPPVRMPPSAMTWTYSPVSSKWVERAPATSAIAVACGTPRHSEPRVGILEARPDALEVEDGQASELADDLGCGRRDHAGHRGGQQRQLEAVV